MLQSLLPGLRDLRAPLAAGYVWLVALWLLLRDSIASHTGPAKLSGHVAELAAWAGKPATFAAITFIAYLVGTLSIAVTRGVNRLAAVLRQTRMEWLIPRYWIDKRIESALDDAVESRFDQYFMDDPKFRALLVESVANFRERARFDKRAMSRLIADLPATSRLEQEALHNGFVRWSLLSIVNQEEYLEAAKRDISHLSYRLLGKEEQMYGEYDRLRSEGTFRLSLALPLFFLFAMLGLTESWWWLVGLPAPVAMAYLAGGSFAEAENTLAAAVTSGRVELPSLERIAVRDVRLQSYQDLLLDENPVVAEPLFESSAGGGSGRKFRIGSR